MFKKIFQLGLILLLSLPVTALAHRLPDLKGHAQAYLSLQDEQFIGDALMRQLRGSGYVSSDPIVTDYLQALGYKLVKHGPKPRFPFTFFRLHDPSLNAFAFLGAHVAVHDGLILTARNESELAGVLAHEITHANERHIVRMMSKNKEMMPITIAEMVAAITLGMFSGRPDAAYHLSAAAMGLHIQNLLSFSRDHEKEADNIGILILAKAKFDPHAMGTMFNLLGKASRFSDFPKEYLSTHPLFENRIAQAQARANAIPYRQPKESIHFRLIKKRLLVQNTRHTKKLIRNLNHEMQQKRYEALFVQQYALGLAHAKAKQYDQALQFLHDSLAQQPDNLMIILSLAEVESAAKKHETALKRLQAWQELYPKSRALNTIMAQTLFAAKKYTEAKMLLTQLIDWYPNESPLHQLLAKTHQKLNNPPMMHLSLANVHYLHGNTQKAIEQIGFGIQQAKGNKEVIAELKTKQKELMALLALEKKKL